MRESLDSDLASLSERLDGVRAREYLPAALIDIVGRTAMLQIESLHRLRLDMSLTPPAITVTPEQHEEGEPLAERHSFAFAPEESARLFGKLLAVFTAVGGAPAVAAERVRAALGAAAAGDGLSIDAACRAVIRDDVAWFADWAARLPEAPDVVRYLAQASITPSIQVQAEAIALSWQGGALLAPERTWEYGVCPVCGSAPLVARVDGQGDVMLCACSFCRHQYRVPRSRCAFCQEQNPERLELLLADDYPSVQVQTCSTCGCYLKVAAAPGEGRVFLPVVEDLESLPLDVLALEEGFRRPSRSAWGF